MWEVIVNLLIFLLGLTFLIYGANFFIQASVKISILFRLTPFFIGIIIVAFGTSLPELGVGVIAAIKNQKAIALGNIVGSNIANIALILGLCSIFHPLNVKKRIFSKELPLMLFSAILLYLLSLDMVLSRLDGLVFLVFFVLFCLVSFSGAKASIGGIQELNDFKFNRLFSNIKSIPIIILVSIVSLFFVLWGADLMVRSGVKMALIFNISPWIVGITIFAIGTSLPELAASLAASFRKVSSISIGNVVGSNIFNILLVLGIVAIIRPITIDDPKVIIFEMPALLIFSVLIYIFMRTSFKISRKEGIVLLLSYLAFIIMLIVK